jgi:hypothetical protein
MGMYVKSTGSGAKCSFCENRLDEGDVYIRLTMYRAWPYIHQKCLLATAKALEVKKPQFQLKFDEAMAKKAANLEKRKELKKEKKLTRNWNNSIIKEALKTQGILVSKISITNPGDRGTGKIVRLARKSDYKPFVFIIQDEAKIFVIHPRDDTGRHTNSTYQIKRMAQNGKLPKHAEVPLADPNALKKIGEAIMEHSIGDWSPFTKKKK